MLVVPVITYDTMVWWPVVEYKASRAKQSKMQMLACLEITYIMKTAPAAATEVILGLPALHLKMETEAQARIYMLLCNEQ